MNWKTWLPLVLAIVVGLVAARLGLSLISRDAADTSAPQVAPVVVSKADIAPGDVVKDTDVAIEQMPMHIIPSYSFRDLNQVIGRVVTTQLVKGQPVLDTLLAPQGAAAGLQATVPEGMRAVTVEVDEFRGVAGLLQPGCYVDVLATFPDDTRTMTCRTVAENLKVVAVGRKIGSVQTEAEKGPVRSVTLVATPRDAERIDLASRVGTPRLVLRGNRDRHVGTSTGVTLSELSGEDAVSPMGTSLMQQPTTQPSQHQWRMVQVIRGGNESIVRFPISPLSMDSALTNTELQPIAPSTTD